MTAKTGEAFEMVSSATTQVRLDGDAVKTLLERLIAEGKITLEESQGCFKQISFETVRTTRLYAANKPTYEPPKFGPNITAAGLVDMLGETREKQKILEKDEGIIKVALAARIAAEAMPLSSPSVAGAAKSTPEEDGIPF